MNTSNQTPKANAADGSAVSGLRGWLERQFGHYPVLHKSHEHYEAGLLRALAQKRLAERQAEIEAQLRQSVSCSPSSNLLERLRKAGF